MKRIVRPITWDEYNVGRIVDSLNKVLVETINTKVLKRDLRAIDPVFDSTKVNSIKLLQSWLEKRYGFADAGKILRPLFVLYDLRVVFAHLVSVRKKTKSLTSACRRLALPNSSGSLKAIYDALIDQLTKMYKEIDARIAQSKRLLANGCPLGITRLNSFRGLLDLLLSSLVLSSFPFVKFAPRNFGRGVFLIWASC